MSSKYDAIVIGGGAKTLVVAMYLAKYGGLKTVIFERLHELGGGLHTAEGPAPGFQHNRHATELADWYWEPLWYDFPDLKEKGLEIIYPPVRNGGIFKNGKCLGLYNDLVDPEQTKTANEIARFSKKDAKAWLALWEKYRKLYWPTLLEWLFSPPTPEGVPDALERLMADPNSGLDSYIAAMSTVRAFQEYFESSELVGLCAHTRHRWQGFPLDFPGVGLMSFLTAMMPLGFVRGGTHRAAHAFYRTYLEHGGEAYSHKEVKKVIIKEGVAKGVVLNDGTEVEGSLVVSGTGPYQLVDLVGEENLSERITRRIRNCTQTSAVVSWYGWALHEAPRYKKAAEFNRDMEYGAHRTHINMEEDLSQLKRQDAWRMLGKVPPPEDTVMDTWCWSYWGDITQAPEGKQVAGSETFIIPATGMSEDKWLAFKHEYAKTLIDIWQESAPNMTWNNIIGYDPVTPYDVCHLVNMSPGGHTGSVDPMPWCSGRFRPTPELAQHRTPIKNLYATGAGWHPGGGGMGCNGYNCYKIIAEDLGLRKPWIEQGRAF